MQENKTATSGRPAMNETCSVELSLLGLRGWLGRSHGPNLRVGVSSWAVQWVNLGPQKRKVLRSSWLGSGS